MKDVNADPGDNGYAGGAWEFYFYSITGQKLMTLNCGSTYCWLGGYNVYFGGKLVTSQYGYPVVTDRLGSVRYSSGVSRSYFPYGEERTVTSDDTEKFGTYFSDAAGQDYAEQRYYNNGTGRFWNVDTGGIKTARPGNPISLNRYAYVNGDPVNHTDRHGLFAQVPICINDDPNSCTDPGDGCYGDGLGFLGMPDPGCDTGGSGGPVAVTPPPDCNAITATAAGQVGFTQLTYKIASEIWSDGGLSSYSSDATAATIAALAAVTWQGEDNFSLNPTNNPNISKKTGQITSVDYGPFQINSTFWPNSNSAIWGTNGAQQAFNGNPDANITYGIQILETLYTRWGNTAAGHYVGSLGNSPDGSPTLGQLRQNTWIKTSATLISLFSNTDCFPHQ